jgi:hypothetical protein
MRFGEIAKGFIDTGKAALRDQATLGAAVKHAAARANAAEPAPPQQQTGSAATSIARLILSALFSKDGGRGDGNR